LRSTHIYRHGNAADRSCDYRWVYSGPENIPD
jgi:hypothetical protein